MNKKTKIIFTGSLVLNLLLIGFITFHMKMRMHPMPMSPMKHFQKMEEELISALPQEKQAEAKKLLEKMHQNRESSFKNHEQTVSELEKILTAEKFDEQEFLKSFKKLGNPISETEDQTDIEVAKFLATLNQKERTDLLNKVKSMHSPFMGRFASGHEAPHDELSKKPL